MRICICIPLSNLRRLWTLLGRFLSGVINLLSHGLSYMATSTAIARLLVKWWETKGNFYIWNIIITYTYCCEIMNKGSHLEWRVPTKHEFSYMI